MPYRVYEVGGNQYFEFFALPYDKHKNPADAKGVLFDTNRSWDEESIWYMMENSRVAAFGDAKRFVENIIWGDIVFFSHKWVGLVAAARVKVVCKLLILTHSIEMWNSLHRFLRGTRN